MPVRRLNHAVLYVRDVARSVEFYREVLGFAPMAGADALQGAAFLQAPASTNDHDLALFEIGAQAGDSEAGRGTVGLYHLGWEVETLADLAQVRERLAARGALAGASDHSTTKALYARDPDGIEFEVCWLLPADRITAEIQAGRMTVRPLDLQAEIARYGADLSGGLGVSVPV